METNSTSTNRSVASEKSFIELELPDPLDPEIQILQDFIEWEMEMDPSLPKAAYLIAGENVVKAAEEHLKGTENYFRRIDLRPGIDIVDRTYCSHKKITAPLYERTDHYQRHMKAVYGTVTSTSPIQTSRPTDNCPIGPRDLNPENMVEAFCYGHVTDQTFWGHWKTLESPAQSERTKLSHESGLEALNLAEKFLEGKTMQQFSKFGNKSAFNKAKAVTAKSDALNICKPNTCNYAPKRTHHYVCEDCMCRVSLKNITGDIFLNFWNHHVGFQFQAFHETEEMEMRVGFKLVEVHAHNVKCAFPSDYGKPDSVGRGAPARPPTTDWYQFKLPEGSLSWAMGEGLQDYLIGIQESGYVPCSPFVDVSNGCSRYPFDDRKVCHLPVTEIGSKLIPNDAAKQAHLVRHSVTCNQDFDLFTNPLLSVLFQENHIHMKKKIAYLLANNSNCAFEYFGNRSKHSWPWAGHPEKVDPDGPHMMVGNIRIEILGYSAAPQSVHQRSYLPGTGTCRPPAKQHLHPAATAIITLGKYSRFLYLDNPFLARNVI